MTTMPRRVLDCLATAALVAPLAGQTPPSEPPPPTPVPAAAPATEAPAWSITATANTYRIDSDRDYVQPTLLADRDWLHLEARWNYEDLDTGSAWVGWNLAAGEELRLEITPMLGVVFGETNGVAPGFRGTLAFGQFELYSESEYLIDTDDTSDSFAYTWSELAWSPTDWLRFGVVAQRTRAYETDLDTQRGLLLGLSFARLDLTAYWFNPDESELALVLGVGFAF
jgi:hypothetical protein